MPDRAPAEFAITDVDGGNVVRPSGDWVVLSLGDAPIRLAQALNGDPATIDICDLGRVDTSGAFALMRVLGLTAPSGIDLSAREDLQRLGRS